MKRVLLTGATGFIGCHVLQRLLFRNYEVAIISSSDSNNLHRITEYYDYVTFIDADLLRYCPLVKEEVQQFSPEVVIHCGWYGVCSSLRASTEQINLNIDIINNLLKVISDSPVETIIGLGSQAEYGYTDSVITEKTQVNPLTKYAHAKIKVYDTLRRFCLTENKKLIWVRVFSAYGPQSSLSFILPNLIYHLLLNKSMALTSAENYWDFLYITDVADALVKAIDVSADHTVLNLASGHSIRLKDAIEFVKTKINPKCVLNYGAIQSISPGVNMNVDTSKISSLLGWTPLTTFDKGVSKLAIWVEKNYIGKAKGI